MNKRFPLVVLMVLLGLGHAFAAPYPIQQARQNLERAHAITTELQSGGKGGIGKNRADIPNLITALSNAELSLDAVKNNKGTHTNVALKFVAEAKAQAATIKEGSTENLDQVQKSIEEALKRVMQAIQVNQR